MQDHIRAADLSRWLKPGEMYNSKQRNGHQALDVLIERDGIERRVIFHFPGHNRNTIAARQVWELHRFRPPHQDNRRSKGYLPTVHLLAAPLLGESAIEFDSLQINDKGQAEFFLQEKNIDLKTVLARGPRQRKRIPDAAARARRRAALQT